MCLNGRDASCHSWGLAEHWLIFAFQMSNITVTYRDGRVAQLEQVYIRGSKIRFLILPDMLKNAPMLKSMKNKNQGSGAGRGKAAILKAQVAARGRGRGMGRGNIFQKRR